MRTKKKPKGAKSNLDIHRGALKLLENIPDISFRSKSRGRDTEVTPVWKNESNYNE